MITRLTLGSSLVWLVLAAAGQVATPAAPKRAWGQIANRAHQSERPLAAVYFGGPANPTFRPLYMRHPSNSAQDGATWKDIDRSLGQVSGIGLNTLILSYWGHDGETDQWSPALLFSRSRWPGDRGDGIYTEREQVDLGRRFYRRAAAHGLLIAPLLEVSPKNPFWKEFPENLDNIVHRSAWLLKQFGDEPNWLQMIDRDGKPRRAIWLIETIHGSRIDAQVFAKGFEAAAERIRLETGYSVGFVLDPTPLPAYGSHEGPDPTELGKQASVLAISPFNITSQGLGDSRPQKDITEEERLAYAGQILTRWARSGIPLIAPVLPGYDAHLVFPEAGTYGFNASWRERQKELALRFGSGGISIDCWNGWTEGYAIPPSKEEGDCNLRWIRSIIRDWRRGRPAERNSKALQPDNSSSW